MILITSHDPLYKENSLLIRYWVYPVSFDPAVVILSSRYLSASGSFKLSMDGIRHPVKRSGEVP